MSGVNHRFGYDTKKIRHYGRLFPTIDFERNESLSTDNYKARDSKSIVGSFIIGNHRYDVTYHELNKILETATAGLGVIDKAHRLGMLPR